MITLGIIDQKSLVLGDITVISLKKIGKSDELGYTKTNCDHFLIDTVRKKHPAMNSSTSSTNLVQAASKNKILFMN